MIVFFGSLLLYDSRDRDRERERYREGDNTCVRLLKMEERRSGKYMDIWALLDLWIKYIWIAE